MRGVKVPGLVSGLSPAVVAGLFSLSVQASEKENITFENNYLDDNKVHVELALAGAAFDERWSAGERAAAAILRREGGVMASATPSYGLHQIGNVYLNELMYADDHSATIKDRGRKRSPATKDTAGASGARCGPARLKPSQIKALVERTAVKHGIDAKFAAAIAWAESDFGRHRDSAAGARGTMQLMPNTARGLGVEAVCDPATNIEAGMRHLRRLLEIFPNPLLAAAAYNAGEAAVLEHGGIPPFQETLRYVARVVDYQIGIAPEKPVADRTRAVSVADIRKETVPSGAEDEFTFIDGVMHF